MNERQPQILDLEKVIESKAGEKARRIPKFLIRWFKKFMHLDFINYDAVESFKDFGGIRLEDDILITPDGSRFLGEKRIPITVEEVEDIMNE